MDLKTIKQQIEKEYKYRIELHAHTTPTSLCSEITPKEMVDIYKELGYDAVVITNHFSFHETELERDEYINFFMNDFLETEKYGKEKGMKVYLGAEIRFTENYNDYLVFGITKEMLGEIYDLLPYGIENFREKYSMPESLLIHAHPKRKSATPIEPHLVDGIEVFNMHPGHNSGIGLAALQAKKEGHKIVTAGSDFHHHNRQHEGLGAIRTKYIPKDNFELAKLLKSGDYAIEIARDMIVLA